MCCRPDPSLATPGYPAAFSAFVPQPPKQNDVLQDLLCGQLGEMFTGNVLYQRLGIPWDTVVGTVALSR